MAPRPIPSLGFGTARLRGEAGANAMRSALRVGIRHFDTAKCYGNEELLGSVLKEAIADGIISKRDDVFITTKVVT